MKHNVEAMANPFSRRQVLGMAAAGAAALAIPTRIFAADAPKVIPIGVQLYSVRNQAPNATDSVLEQFAKMGFTGIEFYNNSYFTYQGKPAELKKKLDDLNLKVPSIHASAQTISGDALKAAMDVAQLIGMKFIIVPQDPGITSNADSCKARAEAYNKAAETLKVAGMACGFHNHTQEFQTKFGDKSAFDTFAELTSKDVILQLDVGHTTAAETDAAAVIRKYPGRFRSVHMAPAGAIVSARGGRRGGAGTGAAPAAPAPAAPVAAAELPKKAYIGQDLVDWKAVIKACREVGDTQWFIIEQENYPDNKPPMECTQTSLEGLKKILAEMA
jgi:sugar phosphate isomerase/epimerase